MKKLFLLTLGVALAACGALAFGHEFLEPSVGVVVLAMAGVAMPQDIATAFAQVFQPKQQFPRWFQPNKNIGQVLVHSQEEEDELKARDWSPKPLPGSEVPEQKLTSMTDVADALEVLKAEQALFEQQKQAFFTQIDARMAALGGSQAASAGAPAAAGDAPVSTSMTPAATQVAGTLSDTSVEVTPKTVTKTSK